MPLWRRLQPTPPTQDASAVARFSTRPPASLLSPLPLPGCGRCKPVSQAIRARHALPCTAAPVKRTLIHSLLDAGPGTRTFEAAPPAARACKQPVAVLAMQLLESSMHHHLPTLHRLQDEILQLSSPAGSMTVRLAGFLALATQLHSVASGVTLLLQHADPNGTEAGMIPHAPEHEGDCRAERAAPDGEELLNESMWEELGGGTAVEQQVLTACAQLLVHVGTAQKDILGNTAVYMALVSEARQQAQGGDMDAAQQQQQHMLLARFQLQGYHPERGGAQYSVALDRQDKLQHLAALRQQEHSMIMQVQHELYSPEACPEVELSSEDLDTDPVLARMLMQQQAPLDPSTPLALKLDLDLAASSQLLRLHPDRSVRRQVYEEAVQARCLEVLDHMDFLAETRRKIAQTHDLSSYSEFAHMDTLAAGHSCAASLLLELAREVRPLVTQQLDTLQQLMPGAEVQPWDLEWLSHQAYARVQDSSGSMTSVDNSWLQGLCLGDVLQGLSRYLSTVMGVTLVKRVPASASPHLEEEQQQACSPSQQEQVAMDLLLAHLSSCSSQDPQPSSSSSSSGSMQVAAAPTLSISVYSVMVEGRGLVGHLVLLPQGGFGTRYLMHGVGSAAHGENGGAEAAGQGSAHDARNGATASAATRAQVDVHGWRIDDGGLHMMDQAGTSPESPSKQPSSECLPVALVGLHWQQHLWQQAEHGGLNTHMNIAAASLHELVHELGHGLHFLLSSGSGAGASETNSPEHRSCGEDPDSSRLLGSSGPAATQRQQQHTALCPAWPGAGDLALELKELPSTLLELLVMQPDVLSYLLPVGAGTKEMLRCMRQATYSPIQFQMQVLTMLLDQLLLHRPTQQHRAKCSASELWVQLCEDFLPGVPPCFTVQQALSLLRVVEAEGQAYAYPAAWCLACQVLEKSGLAQDALNPELGRLLRTRVWDIQPSKVVGGKWAEQLSGMHLFPNGQSGAQLALLVDPNLLEQYLIV